MALGLAFSDAFGSWLAIGFAIEFFFAVAQLKASSDFSRQVARGDWVHLFDMFRAFKAHPGGS
jgi:hypothetical protein